MAYLVHRTPEQGHTKECLAKALICAIENIRDYDSQTDLSFALSVQNNEPWVEALSYLREGLVACYCPVIE